MRILSLSHSEKDDLGRESIVRGLRLGRRKGHAVRGYEVSRLGCATSAEKAWLGLRHIALSDNAFHDDETLVRGGQDSR